MMGANIHLGNEELLETLQGDETLTANASAKQGLADIAILFKLLKAYGIMERVCLHIFLV